MAAAEPRSPAAPGVHLPALDGLRGVAVLMVLVFHFAHLDRPAGTVQRWVLGATGAGWAGVDLFFVLSGFLITGILLDARGASGYFRAFYLRRVLRIFPLYYAYLAVLFFLVPRLAPAIDVKAGTQGWLWTYLGNVLFAREGGFQASPYTGHFWSLAVEEQFYLAWPLLVWWLPRRWLAAACVALALAAAGLRFAIHHTTYNATAAYVLTPCRMDALAVGALAAIAAREPGWWPRLRRWAPALLALSAAAVAAVWWRRGAFFGGDPAVQVWGFLPLAVGFAALLVLAVSAPREARLARFLHAGPLRTAGRYSYGLYVLHYPIFIGMEALGLSAVAIADATGLWWAGVVGFTLAAGGVTLAAALLSWNLLEKHLLAWKDLVPYGRAPAAHGSTPWNTDSSADRASASAPSPSGR